MNKNTKFLLVFLIIGIILGVGGWLVFKSQETEKPIEIKGKLEIVKDAPSFFNKECLNNDFKIGPYYLVGICRKPYLAASLLEMVEKEIEIKGKVKKIKGIEVIEIEEITPPEIIIVATEKTQYQLGEKIVIHFKHYLNKSVFSYFGSENSICAIESIEKKDGEWEKIALWSQPANCSEITPKEIKPYHLSGDFSKVEWQPPALEPGQYKLKIIYKLAGEEEWKIVESNEFIIAKLISPTEIKTPKCVVDIGEIGEFPDKISFEKVVIAHFSWKNYNLFSVEGVEIRYGTENPYRFEWWRSGEGDNDVLTVKFLSPEGKVLETTTIRDPRYSVIFYESFGNSRGGVEYYFLEEGTEYYFFFKLKPIVIGSIEIFERKKLPSPPFAEGETFEGFKPGELLLKIDLNACMKKFCEQIAAPFEAEFGKKDPACEYNYQASEEIEPPAITGVITDHKGVPLKKLAAKIVASEILGTPQKFSTVFVGENGKYTIDSFDDHTQLREGVYRIEIYPSDPNLRDETFEVKLEKNEIKTLNVTLKQCGSVSGKITDKYGNPITEAWVYEADRFEPPYYHVCDPTFSPKCEAGSFLIKNLDAGTRKIGAEVKIDNKYIKLPPQTVQIELGKTTIVNFVFEK